ncbi:MAG: hypothetical protein NC204_05695 [Candidatus Amulumruptor caecigallinarius]|nr:hypothetical protein [Candidatus Amulumruptor caecigallinarius]
MKISGQLKFSFMGVAKEICPGFMIDDSNRSQIIDIFNWCCTLPGRLDLKKGLFLYGNVGTGKSTLLMVVKEFTKRLGIKRHNGFSSFGVNKVAGDVCPEFASSGYKGIERFISAPAQAFDEVGAETIPTAHFGENCNVMKNILMARYDRRFSNLTHITLNLSEEGFRKAYGDRVYDRSKEMFNFVEFGGPTRRKK